MLHNGKFLYTVLRKVPDKCGELCYDFGLLEIQVVHREAGIDELNVSYDYGPKTFSNLLYKFSFNEGVL